MKIGDLVAARFDDSLELGIITGREHYSGDRYTFLYASRRRLISDDLPRSRFIPLRVCSPSEHVFVNLCELDWSDISARDETKDGQKLCEWMHKYSDSMCQRS